MLRFIVFCCLLVLGNCAVRPFLQFKSGPREIVLEAINKCEPDANKLVTMLNPIREGTYTEDDDFKNFIFCGYHSSGYSFDDGRVDKVKASQAFVDHNEAMLKVFNECDKPGLNPVDTTFEFFKCFQTRTPFLLHLY